MCDRLKKDLPDSSAHHADGRGQPIVVMQAKNLKATAEVARPTSRITTGANRVRISRRFTTIWRTSAGYCRPGVTLLLLLLSALFAQAPLIQSRSAIDPAISADGRWPHSRPRRSGFLHLWVRRFPAGRRQLDNRIARRLRASVLARWSMLAYRSEVNGEGST
jgi:hypothetical protein